MLIKTPTKIDIRRTVQAERLRDIADLVEKGETTNVIVIADNKQRTFTIDSIAENSMLLVGMLQTAMTKLAA